MYFMSQVCCVLDMAALFKKGGYNRIKSLDPLRAKKIFIRKAEDGPYLDFQL